MICFTMGPTSEDLHETVPQEIPGTPGGIDRDDTQHVMCINMLCQFIEQNLFEDFSYFCQRGNFVKKKVGAVNRAVKITDFFLGDCIFCTCCAVSYSVYRIVVCIVPS